jgi:tetratricopeptide (TPR) repeat protein
LLSRQPCDRRSTRAAARAVVAMLALATIESRLRAEVPDVALDLASPGGTETFLSVPASQSFFVRVKNRTAKDVYRVTTDLSLAEDSPQPPAAAMHQTYELFGPTESNLRPFPMPEPCGTLRKEIVEALLGRDEAEVAARAEVVQQKLKGQSCFGLQDLLDQSRPQLRTARSLRSTDQLAIRIDKLDPSSKAVVRTWHAVIRAEQPGRRWTNANEEEWIRSEIAREIAKQVLRAADKSPTPAGAPASGLALSRDAASGRRRVRMTIDSQPFEHVFPVEDNAWTPAEFEELAAALLARVRLKPSRGGRSVAALEALTNPTAAVIRSESRRVSTRLAREWRDADAHVEAALVIGSLALREPAGPYADVRILLNRMTAHLALARALGRGAPPSASRQIAEALLASLACRDATALDIVSRVDRSSAPERSWVRAIELLSRGDWRAFPKPEEASLLERLVYYRTLLDRVGAEKGLAFVSAADARSIPDWGLQAMALQNTVSVGNVFADVTARLLDQEMAETWRDVHGSPLADGQRIQALNAGAESPSARQSPPPAVETLPWGWWAAFYQRQILLLAQRKEEHLRLDLGLEADAARFRERASTSLEGLRLYGPLKKRWASIYEGEQRSRAVLDTDSCASTTRLVQTSPEALTFFNWEDMISSCAAERDSGALPATADWFVPLEPAGTAYDSVNRLRVAASKRAKNTPDPEAIRRVAPFRRAVLRYYFDRQDRPFADFALWHETFKPIEDYDAPALRTLASAASNDVAETRRVYAKLASLSPDAWLTLGEYLAHRDMDDPAAAAYENAVAKAPDRIAVSQDLDWYVDYLFDHGDRDGALSVARTGAEVYSSGGLATMARLMERMGRYGEAEAWYKKMAERYPQQPALKSFYIRRARRPEGTRFPTEVAAATAALFPRGIETISMDKLPPQPSLTDGFVPSPASMTEKLRRLGIRSGDLVVALEGIRIRNADQYLAVRSWSDDPKMRVVVWRNGRYEEVNGIFRRFRYGPAAPR